MTEALDWASKWERAFVTPYAPGRKAALVKIYNEQMQHKEAAEARHAAELREQAERFSKVAAKAVNHMARTCFAKGSSCQIERETVVSELTDFILPDPLVEAAQEAFSAMLRANSPDGLTEALRAALVARGYEVRKIGEAGE